MTMSQVFSNGTELFFDGFAESITVERILGSGSQGQVYRARVRDELFALKWYFPAYIRRDRQLADRLRRAISAGSPSQHFIWPTHLLTGGQGEGLNRDLSEASFGYLMPLRPEGYVSSTEHYGGHIDISIQKAITTCKRLCEAFHALHSLGFCYKDLSLGNIFMAPSSGDVLICDNDNADVNGRSNGSIIGTPGFIAPEILLDNIHPNVQSDLFSLSNIVFRLLTRHDPFCGLREVAETLLDQEARLRLYTQEPIFIFHPADKSNQPDSVLHTGVLTTWEIYPPEIQGLFIRAFVQGLRMPSERVLTGEWIDELGHLLDRRIVCCECDSECFVEQRSTKVKCWSCGADVTPTHLLHTEGKSIVATLDTEIRQSHFRRFVPIGKDAVIGIVSGKEGAFDILGLTNCSGFEWRAILRNERMVIVEPGKTCQLSAVSRIHTHIGTIEIEAMENQQDSGT